MSDVEYSVNVESSFIGPLFADMDQKCE